MKNLLIRMSEVATVKKATKTNGTKYSVVTLSGSESQYWLPDNFEFYDFFKDHNIVMGSNNIKEVAVEVPVVDRIVKR